MKLNNKFNIDDKVNIVELDRPGRVIGLYVTKGEIDYQVRFFSNGDAKNIYFKEDELKLKD